MDDQVAVGRTCKTVNAMRSSKSEKDGSKQLCYVHPSHFLVLPANYLKILFFKGSGQSFNLRYK